MAAGLVLLALAVVAALPAAASDHPREPQDVKADPAGARKVELSWGPSQPRDTNQPTDVRYYQYKFDAVDPDSHSRGWTDVTPRRWLPDFTDV